MFNNDELSEKFRKKEELIDTINIINKTVWKERIEKSEISQWCKNFDTDDEKLIALFLLSRFMFFGERQIRELLKSLYRDSYKYDIVEQIRKQNNDTTDLKLIKKEFDKQLKKTRFLGIGNPSESGCHLLYYFRQENGLSKDLFINSHEIFKYQGIFSKAVFNDYLFNQLISNQIIKEYRNSAKNVFFNPNIKNRKHLLEKIKQIGTIDNTHVVIKAWDKAKDLNFTITCLQFPEVSRYIFIDDFCGAGTQAERYSKKVLKEIQNIVKEDDSLKNIQIHYYTLFSTIYGKKHVTDKTLFDKVECVFEFNESYRCFDEKSRYFPDLDNIIKKDPAREMCEKYGNNFTLEDNNPLGYGDCQLLIGFFHNIPNNTLPIIWYDERFKEQKWIPILKRYKKIY